MHISAGRAQAGRGSGTGAKAAKQLDFERDGEVLIESHALRRLSMDHDSVVSIRPAERWTGAHHLTADESVLGRHEIVREWPLVEDVAELPVEGRPSVIAHLQQSVLDAKGVVEIVVQRVLGELDIPVREIASVEQLDPVRRRGAAEAGAVTPNEPVLVMMIRLMIVGPCGDGIITQL